MKPLVSITDLVITYEAASGAVLALDEASLTVREGETLAIVGESGSGKTTLGMAAGRLLPQEARASAGEIIVDGIDVLAADDARLRKLRRERLGFVFQNPMAALDPTMRVGHQIAGSMPAGSSADDIVALLARAELVDPDRIVSSFPHELSGGMAQRVIIAMAIARTPKLVIADEPTASLDASIREKVMATLGRLRGETGASLLVLSHDLRLVSRHADRIAVMYGGRVVEVGESRDVMERPAHAYTRALIAAAAGNEQMGKRLEPIPGTPPILRERCGNCAFEPRCAFREELCATERPLAREVDSRLVACHFAERVLAESGKDAPR